MENKLNFSNFSIEEKGNDFLIQKKEPSKKYLHFMIVWSFIYTWVLYLDKDLDALYFFIAAFIGSLIMFWRYYKAKNIIICKEDIQSMIMKNGIFSFNTILIIKLKNGQKIRLYFQDEKETKSAKFLLESPVAI